MKIMEYEDKENKIKARAVDVESLLEDMQFLEDYHGSAVEDIKQHYYALKRDLLSAVTAKIAEDQQEEKL